MNPQRRFYITFGSILLIGALAFIYQTRRLGEIEQRVESRSAVAENAAPPLEEPRTPDKPAAGSAAETNSPDTDAAEEFIGKLKSALAASLTEDQVTSFMKLGENGVKFETLVASVDLTDEESSAIREGLEKYQEESAALYLDHDLPPAALAAGLAGVKSRQDKWLAGQLGAERYAAFVRHDEQRVRDSAKQRAATSVSRIASAADLTEAQREKLNEGFLELNLRPTPPPENKLVVTTFGNLTMGPSAPDLSEDMEEILTPEQLGNYQLQRDASAENTEGQSEAMMEMMQSLLPAVIQLLEEDL